MATKGLGHRTRLPRGWAGIAGRALTILALAIPFRLAAAAPSALITTDLGTNEVLVERPSDGLAVLVARGAPFVRHVDGSTSTLQPDAVAAGLVEHWPSSSAGGLAPSHSVTLEADALGLSAFRPDDLLVLTWTVVPLASAEHVRLPRRLVTEVPLGELTASPQDPPRTRMVTGTAIDRLLDALADRSRLAASASCPPDLETACDGRGNAIERQAWLDTFTGAPDPGCGLATLSFEFIPGSVTGSLNFPDFADLSDWTLNGATGTLGNPVMAGGSVLRLTNDLSQSGSAFVTSAVPLPSDASFTAFFTFRIGAPRGASDGDGLGADGLAFVVQTVSNTAGGLGGGIGYQGIARSVGVEFDTWDNGAWDDFDGNHVGIDLAGAIDSTVQAPVTPRMNDGQVWNAWVDYDGTTDVLEARVSLAPTRPAIPLVSTIVDLPTVLGTTDAFVGFTSGTGAAAGDHDILSFFFNATRQVSDCGVTGAEVVIATVIDDCGRSASCTRLFSTVDRTPPALLDAITLRPACAEEITAGATSWTGGPAVVAVVVEEACDDAPVVTNDRTATGMDASGDYPCGLSAATFTATDACGNVETCQRLVRVLPPGQPPSVGGLLRVSKDPSGAPRLDWTGAPPLPPTARFGVLRADDRAAAFALPDSARALVVVTWTETDPAPPLLFYDVRSLDCAGTLSLD